MRISDILNTKGRTLVSLDQKDTLDSAIQLMHEHEVGSVVVTGAAGLPVGIVSQTEIMAALYALGTTALKQCVHGIMRKGALQCLDGENIQIVMARMVLNRVRHFVVADADGMALGLVSMGDLVAARLKSYQLEADVLRDMARTCNLVAAVQ
jgi:predicted transcriptional regulator